MAEIERKAKIGEKMMVDTPEKIAAYNSFASADNNPYAPKPAQPSFYMDSFNNAITGALGGFTNNFNTQFGQMQSMYDSRFSALEKMLGDMQNKNKYDEVQRGNANKLQQDKSIMPIGTHQFEPNANQTEQGAGYTQSENSMNQSLFKYLNNMWNGGF